MRYQLSFPIVIPRYQAGYLRVTHPFATHPEKQAPPSAFYLHVLGTPPAFVLSQDQTLIKSLSSHSFLSLTDLLFFHCSVLQQLLQCPAHWFVLFSFQRSLSLASLKRQLYQYITVAFACQHFFETFFNFFNQYFICNIPQSVRDSNPCYRREKAVS